MIALDHTPRGCLSIHPGVSHLLFTCMAGQLSGLYDLVIDNTLQRLVANNTHPDGTPAVLVAVIASISSVTVTAIVIIVISALYCRITKPTEKDPITSHKPPETEPISDTERTPLVSPPELPPFPYGKDMGTDE